MPLPRPSVAQRRRTVLGAGLMVSNVSVTSNNYNINRQMNTFWTGIRWSLWDNLDLAAAFYYQTQNDFNFTVNKQGYTVGAACTATGAFISSTKCAGSQDAISIFAD
jgi:hypothetical protein